MNKTSQNTALLLAALVAVGQLAGAAETNTATATAIAKPLDIFANDIVAQGKDVKVSRAMLDERVISFRSAASARGEQIPPQRMKMVELNELSQLIGLQLLNKSATAEDKATGAENAKQRLEMLKQNSGGEENFARQLKASGVSAEDIGEKLNAEAVAEAVLQREVKFEVSDNDVKKFYDENPDRFEQPEQVRAAHVLIATREKDGTEMGDDKKKVQLKLAEDIMKRARAGEDFTRLAKENSEETGTKEKGDSITFSRGHPQIPAEFEAAAFSLATNQVSEVVPTMFGYHVIKLYEKLPAKKQELAEVESRVKHFLKQQGMMKLIPGYIAQLEKAANVEILDAELKKRMDEAKADQAAAASAAEAKKPESKK